MNLYKTKAPKKEDMIQEIIRHSEFYDESDLKELRCRNLRSIEFIYKTCVFPGLIYN